MEKSQPSAGRPASPFLRIPPGLRRDIYLLAGLPQQATVHLDAPWAKNIQRRPRTYSCDDDGEDESEEEEEEAPPEVDPLVPGLVCTRHLLLTCRAISSEVAALLYSQNAFITQDTRPLERFRTATLGSLRNLRIVIYCMKTYRSHHACVQHYPARGMALDTTKDEGRAVLGAWKKTAAFLGRNVSADRLNLSLICDVADQRLADSQVAAAEELLATLAHFPLLAGCEVSLGPRPSKTIHELARVACERSMIQQEDPGPFRFMDLPVEIRLRILEHTDLVAPVPSLSWDHHTKYRVARRRVKGMVLRTQRARARHCGVYGTGCFCSTFHAGYSRSCRCWHNPQALFLVNKTLLAEARDVFFRHHHFQIREYWQNSTETSKEYPGTDYFREGILPQTRRLLQSMNIYTIHGARAENWTLNWMNTIRGIRQEGGLSLRYLRLGVPFPNADGLEDVVSWTPEKQFETFRSVIHECFWPMDAGHTACLPFGTQSLEVRMSGLPLTVEYRVRMLSEPRKRPWGLEDSGSPPSASRVLVGGDVGNIAVEHHALEGSSAADWIEELWIHKLKTTY